jgi:hypothetical protein
MAQMPFAKHNDMVKAVPANRADRPLAISVLPGRLWRTRSIPDAHRPDTLDNDVAIDPVTIAQQITRCRVPAEGFRQLPSNPFGRRMPGDAQPCDLASVMPQNQQSEQKPKGHRRNDKEVHCRNAIRMIA